MVTVDGINEKTSVAEAIRKAQDFAPELKTVIPPRGFAFNVAGVPVPTDTAKVTVESADALNAVAWTPGGKSTPISTFTPTWPDTTTSRSSMQR